MDVHTWINECLVLKVRTEGKASNSSWGTAKVVLQEVVKSST